MITYQVDVQTKEGRTSIFVMAPEAEGSITPELVSDMLSEAVHIPEGAEVLGIMRLGVGVVMVAADGKTDLGVPDALVREITETVEDIGRYCDETIVKGWKTGLMARAAALSKWVPVA